ncbi:sugar fermentation stimulation protein [Enterococcus faecalis 13-SD-W-01]|nr:sugar fermentation stimulation protein [Enterococcus faecalis 13-SD-W-01]
MKKLIYPEVKSAVFMERPNRFIAYCRLKETNEVIIAHVKNTGRGKEVLIPGAEVAVAYAPGPKRKTDYDLIAVKKQGNWFNIDSQIPNKLAYEGILDGKIQLPNIEKIRSIRREVVYGNSKFDLYLEAETGLKAFVEVKGMTLENREVGAFPDAPTLRGLKHVKELTAAKKAGYEAYVLFIVQFETLHTATIHEEMQPALAEAIEEAQAQGVHVLAYNCSVQADEITVKQRIPFVLDYPFEDPIILERR